MSAHTNGIGTPNRCTTHGIDKGERGFCPLCPSPKKVKTGLRRTPLQAKSRLGDRRRKLAPDYSRDEFLDRVMKAHGDACWLSQFFDTPCDGVTDPIHFYPKKILIDRYPKGAIVLGENWSPYDGEVEIERGAHIVELSEILLDTDNGRCSCRHHHSTAGDTFSGVDPECFPDSVKAFGWRHRLVWFEVIEFRRAT